MSKQTSDVGIRSDHLGSLAPLSPLRRGVRRAATALPWTIDAYQLVRSPAAQAAVWGDYLRWRRGGRLIRALPAPPTGAPKALLVSFSDQIFDVKLRCVVATALRAKGWDAVALTRTRRAPRQYRLYRAAGITEFIVHEELELSAADAALCDRTAHELLSGELTFAAVKEWRFRDAWIGPQLLSSASRRLLDGHPDPAIPEVREQIEQLLHQMLRDVIKAESIIDRAGAAIGVLDEYNYSMASPVVDVGIARGVDFITIRHMFRDDGLVPMRLTAATRRMHHASVSPETLDDLAAREWTAAHGARLDAELAARYDLSRQSTTGYQGSDVQHVDRSAIVDRLGLDPAKKIVVVFSHVLWDANLFYGEDLYDDFGDWLGHTVRVAREVPDVSWVVKLHPANLEKRAFHGSDRVSELELIQRYAGDDLPAHITLMFPQTDISALSLYQHADIGITVRGTPGIEMPCFGKPVLTAGTGRYAGLGFTVDSDNRVAYESRLRGIDQIGLLDPDEVQRARWHAYALFCLREWRPDAFELVHARGSDVADPLAHNILIAATSTEQLLKGRDLDDLSAWAVGSPRWDYVAEDPV